MINLYHKTPQVYYDDSRDFQTIARVLEILSNESKTEIDLIRECPFSKNVDIRLLSLLAKTIGFDNKHKYNESEFRAICSSFVEIMHNKGSMRGIKLTIETFLAAQGISGRYQIIYAGENVKSLTIVLPVNVSSTTLLEDVFDYIMPAGQAYTFLYADIAGKVEDANVVVSTEAEVNKTFSSGKLSVVSNNTNTTVPTYENLSSIDESSIAYIGVVSDGTIGEGPTPGPVTDLSGTKWEIRQDVINGLGASFSYSVNFSSNDSQFNSISFTNPGGPPSGSYIVRYQNTEVWNALSEWTDQAYRTIEITGGIDATNADLIAWLEANATQM